MRTIFGSRRRGRTAAAAAAVAAVALSATPVASSVVPAAANGGKAQPRRAGSVRVAIKGFAYRPPTLRIRRGTRVVFANRDGAPHTATRRGSFDTGPIRSGHAAAVRFGRRGVYSYVCTIHPFMHGKLVVR